MVATKKVYSVKATPVSMPKMFFSKEDAAVNYWVDSLYNNMRLFDAHLSRNAFYNACIGY